MLDTARERAAALGRHNVEFMEWDAGRLDFPDGSFDSVLCRWGVTSLPDPGGVLVAIRRLLPTGGSFVTAIWKPGREGRPLASLATAVAGEMIDLPASRSEVASRFGLPEN